jgi:hypothetical protein
MSVALVTVALILTAWQWIMNISVLPMILRASAVGVPNETRRAIMITIGYCDALSRLAARVNDTLLLFPINSSYLAIDEAQVSTGVSLLVCGTFEVNGSFHLQLVARSAFM